MKKFSIIIILFIIHFQYIHGVEEKIIENHPYLQYYSHLLKDNINFKDFMYNPAKTKMELGFTFEYIDKLKRFQYKKEEDNPIRRAEILFFGSLTFVTFGGWLFFSIFNMLIYDEPFGKLRRDQFLILYLGSGIISLSVSLSDIFIKLKPKMKNVEIY